jgi:Mn2+/Fe2+ NRAMP family transporter
MDSSMTAGSPPAQTDQRRTADPTRGAMIFVIGLLLFGLAISLVGGGFAGVSRNQAFLVDEANFALFAAFYAAAFAVERLLEPITPVIPPRGRSPKERVDRGLIMFGLALLVSIGVSMVFGLYFMQAVGVSVDAENDEWLRGLDIFVTALVISGGTKKVHDFVKLIENKSSRNR